LHTVVCETCHLVHSYRQLWSAVYQFFALPYTMKRAQLQFIMRQNSLHSSDFGKILIRYNGLCPWTVTQPGFSRIFQHRDNLYAVLCRQQRHCHSFCNFNSMALHSLYFADVPLCALTQPHLWILKYTAECSTNFDVVCSFCIPELLVQSSVCYLPFFSC